VARPPGRDAIYETAELFRQRCLVENKSLLWPGRSVWASANTSALWAAFMERPDTSKRSFLEKWHDQLQDESENVHRLAVELIALYNLFPTTIGKETKLREVATVMSWKLSEDKPEMSLLDRAFDRGLGNPGPQYLFGKPWQIAFYLEFARRFIQEGVDPQNMEAYKRLANNVQNQVQQSGAARNIMLHLLFPNYFERIASDKMRSRIVEVFSDDAGGETDQDSALLNIRRALQQKYGREQFDFYDKDIASLWRQGGLEPVCFWIEKTLVRGRADREKGEFALGKALWSPKQDKRGGDIYRFMRELKPGDVVFHLTDNEGITAISRVESEFEEFGGVADTEWGTNPSYLVRLRDTLNLLPPLDRSVFFSEPFSARLKSLIDAGVKNLFYNREPALNQGAYLTPAPTDLVRILDDAYKVAANKSLAELVPEIAELPSIRGDNS
jgi:hypothetical protein